MSRSIQDQFIDEDEEEEVCPLCVEELDITDRNFRPCPCGYQICQFCYNNIKTTMNGLCPACRRQYKDENIEWKAVSQEEMAQHRQSLAQQAKKKAAAKQKEAQKREADNLSRKHLAGLRVRQKNLVYVTGMKPKLQGDRLIEVLRGPQYFGQYGDIVKIVVANPAKMQQASIGIYITFTRNEDAASCIATINGSYTDGSLRAQFGTTKYCSAYLRGETCNNRQCMFLHEPGDENERYTRQDLSSLNASSSQQPASSKAGPSSAPVQPIPIAAATQDYTDSAVSPSDLDADVPALPATASWADSARRTSRATIHSGGSPSTMHATLPQAPAEMTDMDFPAIERDQAREETAVPDAPVVAEIRARKQKTRKATRTTPLDHIMKMFSADLAFTFSAAHLSDDEKQFLEYMPQLWDPKGGEKRRELKEREAEESRRIQQEAQSIVEASLPDTEDLPEGGSLALGGEPEEQIARTFSQPQQQGTIQPPPGHHMAGGLGFGGLTSADLAALGGKRALTPQQHQQLLLQQFRGENGQAPVTSAQHVGSHGRNQSRFNFAESGITAAKQSQDTANPLKQQTGNAHVYTTVQGPPPGLRPTGTPPVSGGGMFGQGHNFPASLGYAAGVTRENDKIWDFHRSGQRGVTGANQLAEAGKRELMFSYLQQHPSATAPSPAPGLFQYGSTNAQSSAFSESGSSKQKKKGKKQRHTTTSSGGAGGANDNSDPSILSARLHQQGNTFPGQTPYGAQARSGAFPAYGDSFARGW